MATVRITDRVIAILRGNIEKLFCDAITAAENNFVHADVLREIASTLHKKTPIAKELKTIVEKTQDTWVNTYSGIRVVFAYTKANGQDSTAYRSLVGTEQFAFPNSLGRYDSLRVDDTYPCYGVLVRSAQEVERIVNEREALKVALIDNIAMKCTTLKQVLEAWPSALDFLDDATRAKHNENTVRASPAKRDELVVAAEVKAQLLTARMRNGH